MLRILGIDTSNYTTSIAVVENNRCILDSRKLLEIKSGERGLRQSEALFQHMNNLPELLNNKLAQNINGICVSTKPRPVTESYMPVFKSGENIARSIGFVLGKKVIETTHQEGHIEAAVQSINFRNKEFIAIHMSGGTTEILKVSRNINYDIKIIGGTRDISAGQFIDRIGVALGYKFPAGGAIDALALKCKKTDLRIPSKVDGFNMNFSGQETMCMKYIKDGYNNEEIACATALCISKTMEKIINNIKSEFNLPVLIMGGVASSSFIRNYLKQRFNDLVSFSKELYSSDNAVGVAFIGYKKILEVE